MSLTIGDDTMTSDQSPHTARHAPGHRHGWEVSWLPGQILDRDTAITAMILADIAATGDIHPDHRLWPAVQSWSAEVGLTGPDAIKRAVQPPPDATRQPQPADRRAGQLEPHPDREAVDHITARRLAIWIAARPQPAPFSRALTAFTQTGTITRDLRNHLRAHARSAAYPHRPQAAWLLDYCIARGPDTGPLGPDFAAA